VSKKTYESAKDAVDACGVQLQLDVKLSEHLRNKQAGESKTSGNVETGTVDNSAQVGEVDVVDPEKEAIIKGLVESRRTKCTNKIDNSIARDFLLVIKDKKVFLSHNNKEELLGLLDIDCVIFANNHYETKADKIVISSADRDIEVVDVGIGELCLRKKDVFLRLN